MSGTRKAINRLNDTVSELTSFHVQTYTGQIEVDLERRPQDGNTGLDEVHDLVEQAKGEGKVVLVAEAYYQLDGDSYDFLTSHNVPATALELHRMSVEAGMATRRGLLKLVRDVFD